MSSLRLRWRNSDVASPASICEISFRLVNLWSAFQNNTQPLEQTCNSALEIDADLSMWKDGLPSKWRYSLVNATETKDGTLLDGKQHIYSSSWITDVWNNWRALRMLTNQIVLEAEAQTVATNADCISMARSRVQNLARDICISAASFGSSPRKLQKSSPLAVLTLVVTERLVMLRPLYAVVKQQHADWEVRSFASKELRQLGEQFGIGQASFLADMAMSQTDEHRSQKPNATEPHPRVCQQTWLDQAHQASSQRYEQSQG